MKLFSRKAIVAAATALTVSTTGAVAAPAAFAAETSTVTNDKTSTYKEAQDDEKKDEDNGLSSGDTSAKDIKEWIGVFTAVIGALGTIFAFASKYFNVDFGK